MKTFASKKSLIILIIAVVLSIVAISVTVVLVTKKSNNGIHTVIFDYNYEGSISSDEQRIENGGLVTEPEIPHRDGYVFYGWLTNPDVEAWSQNPADLSSFQIFEDITFYAIWYSDELDEDGDGLPHANEIINNTDAFKYDTDEDGLSDGDEVNTHHTNPCKGDSDDDGILDGAEVALKLNPLNSHSDGITHDTERTLEAVYEDFNDSFELKITSKANMLSTVSVQTFDNDVISDPTGLISPVFDVQYDKTYSFDSAELVFDYSDADLSGINEDDLTFLYINEETGKYEAVSSVVDKEKKIVVAKPTHFSAYVVGDKNNTGLSINSISITTINHKGNKISVFEIADTGFDIKKHSFAFHNFEEKWQRGGFCTGFTYVSYLSYIGKLPIKGTAYNNKYVCNTTISGYDLTNELTRFNNNQLYYDNESELFVKSKLETWFSEDADQKYVNSIRETLNCIIYWWGKQTFVSTTRNLSNIKMFSELLKRLENGTPVPIKYISLQGNHSVLAYKAYKDGLDYYIAIYDSNEPGKLKYIKAKLNILAVELSYGKSGKVFLLSDEVEIPDDESLFIKHTTEETNTTVIPETTQTPETEPTPETTEHIHDYAETERVASTCTKEGIIKSVCACGEITVSSIPVTDHTFENKICSACGFSISKASEGLEITKYTSYCEIVGIGKCKDEYIVLPDTYQGLPVTMLSDEAFKDCEFIKGIYIPASIIEITGSRFTNSPFRNCPNLKSIEVDPNNTIFHSSGNCLIITERKLLIAGCKNSILPNDGSVKTIGYTAFMGSSIERVIIPDSVTVVGMSAFYKCNNLKYLYLTANSMNTLDAPIFINRFPSCPIKEVVIADDFTDLEKLDFNTLKSLTVITLGKGISVIKSNDFYRVSELTTLNLNNTIERIEENAFVSCSNLTAINFNGTLEQWEAINKNNGWDSGIGNYTVYCLDGKIKK